MEPMIAFTLGMISNLALFTLAVYQLQSVKFAPKKA